MKTTHARPRAAIAAVVAMLMLLTGLCRLAAAQVLEQVPEDALFVIKINRLQDTSTKVANFAKELGLAAMAEEMQDPLGAIQKKLKIVNGVDKAGEFALVMVDPARAGGNPDDAMLMLVPISDYQQFLTNWPDAKTDGAVSEVQLGDGGKPGFVSNWGKYAVISPSKD